MQYKETENLVPPRASDPGWAHGIMVNGGRQKIKCKYCNKVMLGGGISRLKQHLAGERGNVSPCEKVPEEVKVQIKQHLGFKVLEKIKRQKGTKSSKNSVSHFQSREAGVDVVLRTESTRRCSSKREVVEGISSRPKRLKTKNLHPVNQSFTSQESIDQADEAVAKFMYEAGIPFTASNSHYFQQMADAVAAAGPGYKMPSYHSLRGKLLTKSVRDVEEYIKELKKSWEVTGCSIMVDQWKDRNGCVVLNFFVYCPKGIMFLKSVNGSNISKSPEELVNLFEGVVQEVGQNNIVNFVTDTSPTYKAAGKLLAEKYKSFFSSTCALHCIDLMLEEIEKIIDVREVLGKAKRITQLIYNNSWVLNQVRKRSGGRDIVELGATRFLSIFLTLKTIVSLKQHLHQIFTSNAWMQSVFSRQRAGIEVAEIIVDPYFWSRSDTILMAVKPLLSVLHLTDREEKPSVGYIYDTMEKIKRSIMVALDNRESEYLPYLMVIDRIWLEELHSPLHAAAYYLNPSVFYSASFSSNKVIQKGLLDCIETLEPNETSQVMITSNINFYVEAIGDFGRPVALRSRESLAPATWWSLYGADYPDLQRLAVRILSQTCISLRCDRRWSTFERSYLKNKNRLEHQRLNDLLLVHYNLGLQERRRSEMGKWRSSGVVGVDPICLEAMNGVMGDWVEDSGAEKEEVDQECSRI